MHMKMTRGVFIGTAYVSRVRSFSTPGKERVFINM